MKPHEGDKGVDVGDGHGRHVAELRGRFVDDSDVRGESSSGIVLEGEAFFQSTRKKFVRDNCVCEEVEGEDVCPHCGATGGPSAWVAAEHFKKGAISQEAWYRRGELPRADMDLTSSSQGPWVGARRAVIRA